MWFKNLFSIRLNQQKAKGNVVTDIDGNVYRTVTIGSQIWMAENLKVTHYRNGDAIPKLTYDKAWGNVTIGAYCEYDNNTMLPVGVLSFDKLRTVSGIKPHQREI